MGYLLQLQVFEGPLDLLLFLIKKNEVDIFDIPISLITDQFIEYIELMKLHDIDDISDFVLMVSTLMHIKSKMLLPVDKTNLPDDEDPRTDLVKRLIEYKKFKEVAQTLEQKEFCQRNIFTRVFNLGLKENLEKQLVGMDLFDLLKTFEGILERAKPDFFHEVVKENVSLSQKINELLDMLTIDNNIEFEKILLSQPSKMHMVVCFLALLELTRLKSIRVRQSEAFGIIQIEKIGLVDNFIIEPSAGKL